MPGLEAGTYLPRLDVPIGLRANEEVFVCRYTGQIFREYEDYVKQITAYNQRQWTDRYSGTKGLTYEEAVSREYPIQSVIDQFPAVYEEPVLRMVQHATQPVDELCTSLQKHLHSRLCPGEPVLATIEGGGVAPCMIQRFVPNPSGGPPSEYEIAWLAATGVPTGHLSRAHAQLLRRPEPSLLDRLTPALLKRWLEVVATWQPFGESASVPGVWLVHPHFAAKHRLPETLAPELESALRDATDKQLASTEQPVAHAPPPVDQVESDAALARAVAAAEGTLPGTTPGRPQQPTEQHGVLAADDVEGSEAEATESDDEYRPGGGGGHAAVGGTGGIHGGVGKKAPSVAKRKSGGGGRKTTSEDDAGAMAASGGGAAPSVNLSPGATTTTTTPPKQVNPGPEPPPAAMIPSTRRAPAPAPTVDGILALQASSALTQESLEDAVRRIQPGSIKAAVFQVLREAGDEGLTIQDAAQRIQESGLKSWDDLKAARNSVASTCGHDAAFLRVGPGKFALRALVPNSAEAELASAEAVVGLCCGDRSLDDTAKNSLIKTRRNTAERIPFPSPLAQQDKALALVETQLAEAARKLRDERAKPRSDHNAFKCPRCHRATHPDGSPLLLCDTCPRAYHLVCLGGVGEGAVPAIGWNELPAADWACPKCVEGTQAALRRVLDLDARRKEALERAQAREREAEDRLLKRLLAKEERDRRKVVGPGSGPGGLDEGSPTPASTTVTVAAKKVTLDDWDLLEEEKEHLVTLEARAAELEKERVVKQEEEGGNKVIKAEEGNTVADGEAMASSAVGEKEDVTARASETAEAIAKLRLLIEGPLTPAPLLDNDRERKALERALETAEFLQLFGNACESESPDVDSLLTQVRWPLDGDGLAALYHQLTLCCLIEQQNQDPPMKATARRWGRVLTGHTWPEILRRYLLATRGRRVLKDRSGEGGGRNDDGDDDDDDQVEDDDDDDAMSTGRNPRHIHLDELPTEDVHTAESDALLDPLALSDEDAVLLAARELSRGPWHALKPELHLRLLGAMCYDIAQGYALRADINTRLQDSIKLQTEFYKDQMAWRRERRALQGNGAPMETVVQESKGSKGKKGAGKLKGRASTEEEEQAEEEDQDDDDDDDREKTDDGSGPVTALDQAQAAWSAKEAEYEVRLAQRASRAEPLGFDRHHRRYWWLGCAPGVVMVDFPDEEGRPLAALRSKGELSELMTRLNRRGPRERGLHISLRRKFQGITACMEANASASYALSAHNRPPLRDKRMAFRTVEELAVNKAKAAILEARERLDSLLIETGDVGCELDADVKAFRKELRACESAADLSIFLLGLERVYCVAGEGLPPGATNDEVRALLGDKDEAVSMDEEKRTTGEPSRINGGNACPNDKGGETAAPMDTGKGEGQGDATAVTCGAAVENGAVASSRAPSRATTNSNAMGDNNDPSASGTTSRADSRGEASHSRSTNVRLVTPDDDLDDSDAEHAYLREKRMRRPARLWRSARERAAWIASARFASTPSQVCYCAALLCDRAGPMLQRYITLAEEAAKWEALERERVKAEKAAAAAASRRRAEEESAAPLGPTRPMMIRTGKAKTDEGVRVVLRAMGRDPFPSGRAAAAMDVSAPPEVVAECRWGYQCSVCLLAGDLLCCEHPGGCNVSAHVECSGGSQAFPHGPWICSNHDDRDMKTRIRRKRGSAPGSALVAVEEEDADSEATVSETGGGGADDDDDDSVGYSGRRRGKRPRAAR